MPFEMVRIRRLLWLKLQRHKSLPLAVALLFLVVRKYPETGDGDHGKSLVVDSSTRRLANVIISRIIARHPVAFPSTRRQC